MPQNRLYGEFIRASGKKDYQRRVILLLLWRPFAGRTNFTLRGTTVDGFRKLDVYLR